jgi:hypothetical protein
VMVLGGSPVGGQSEPEVGAGRPINLDQTSSVTQDQ